MRMQLECGCYFEVHDEHIKECDGLPSISIDFEHLTHDCPKTWELLGTGHTKGVFQLETNLGQSWSKKLEPWNIEELSALISLMRPGCLRALSNGKSMTQHYVDRKHGREESEALHPLLEPILESTYQVLTYQEQSMRIAQELAGFTLQEADILRKAIGKKKPEIMAECEKSFLEGCKKKGLVSESQAKEIFSWIRESQKYSFNKSHGYGYGEISFWSAYAKAHFPLHFFTSWLYYSHEKPEQQVEVQELISDAKLNDICVSGPSLEMIAKGEKSFSMKKDGIYFGIKDIKRIGENHIIKFVANIREMEKEFGPIQNWSWEEFLMFFSDKTTTTVINNLILVGACDCYMKSRRYMLYEFQTWNTLTDKEKNACRKVYKRGDNLVVTLNNILSLDRKSGGPANVKRVKVINDLISMLDTPTQSLQDEPGWISKNERDLLGVSLTYNALDNCSNIVGNTTCKEFLAGVGNSVIFSVEIVGAREYIIKNGPNKGATMCFLSVEDYSCRMDNVLAFASTYKEYKNLLYVGNTVIIQGKRSDKGDSLIVEKVEQLI